jgi:hypothetical protein
MFIQVEPAGFFMYTVRLIFDLENLNPEDQQVRDYMVEHELEPKYQWSAEMEGSQCEFMQFGGCYLGRHLESIGQIQRRVVELELLTAEVETHLKELASEEVGANQDKREATLAALVEEFHVESSFQANEQGELTAILDGNEVRESARRLFAAP